MEMTRQLVAYGTWIAVCAASAAACSGRSHDLNESASASCAGSVETCTCADGSQGRPSCDARGERDGCSCVTAPDDGSATGNRTGQPGGEGGSAAPAPQGGNLAFPGFGQGGSGAPGLFGGGASASGGTGGSFGGFAQICEQFPNLSFCADNQGGGDDEEEEDDDLDGGVE
jgi:hypothetical protein